MFQTNRAVSTPDPISTWFSVTCPIAKDTAHIDTPFIFWGSGKVWIDMDSVQLEVVK